VDIDYTPLGAFESGQAVEVQDYGEPWLGSGYVNPHSLICARLVSRDRRYPWSASLIVHCLKVALALHQPLFEQPFYRLVHGESARTARAGGDRFDDLLVTQSATAAMSA
jgi:23S rRNA (cytosine1962-C5)-methyltransferase